VAKRDARPNTRKSVGGRALESLRHLLRFPFPANVVLLLANFVSVPQFGAVPRKIKVFAATAVQWHQKVRAPVAPLQRNLIRDAESLINRFRIGIDGFDVSPRHGNQ
jgi:hypothetical protein